MAVKSKNAVRRGHGPTMDDVAAAAGVSRALVSLVMAGSPKVSEERRGRVLEAAAQLGYRPNAMARSLASRRTRNLAVLLDDLRNPYFAEVAGGVEAAASAAGMRVLLASGERRHARERALLDAMLEQRPDAVIVVGTSLTGEEATGSGAEHHPPVVFVGKQVRRKDVDCVTGDDTLGAQLVVDHLVALGHERIAHVDGGQGAGAAPRRTGFTRAMRAAGLEPDVLPGDFTDVAGARAVDELLRRGDGAVPTAIWAGNDFTAAGVLDRLDEAGLHVPDDVSVVGYDDIYLARLRRLSLTTVAQPREQIGRLAVRLALERLDGRGERVVERLEPRLVVRSSTGPARRR